MVKQRKIANTVADPTLRTVEVEIKGKKYTLCFDLGSLAEAEMHFRRQGEEINLLDAFSGFTLSSVMVMFPCAVRKFHPELSFKEAQNLLKGNMSAVYLTATYLALAWKQAMPDADPEKAADANPNQP